MNKMRQKRTIKIGGILVLIFLISISVSLPNKEDKISPRLLNLIQERGEFNRFAAWIYFSDKGPDLAQKIKTTSASLNLRALSRRLRSRKFSHIVDKYDVSVHAPYVEECRKYSLLIRHESRWLNAVSVEATGFQLKRLSAMSFVKRIDKVATSVFREPDLEPKASIIKSFLPARDHILDYGPSYTQVDQLQVPALHDLGYSGQGVLICMLDSGFNNLSHQALEHIDIVGTWDFVNNDPNVFDELDQMGNGDHGNHTLGTIAGYYPGKLIGPAYGASFLLAKTENTDWERHVEEDHWIAGAEWADELGADIVSSSLGYRDEFTSGESDYSWEDLDGETTVVTMGANIAASRGILVVNSVGNGGASEESWLNTIIGPADSIKVLAVGAVNSQGARVDFSSTGPTADGRIKPDVMAQGYLVYSANPESNDKYDSVNGTSFSCPLVAGVAALVLEANPTWANRDIMTALKSTANNSDSPNNHYGWGIVNAQAAAAYSVKHIHPPDKFAMLRIENNYGFFVQYVDRLSWRANPRNGSSVEHYRLYARQLGRQGVEFKLIAELNNQTFNFERRGFFADETFLYKITSISVTGEESDPDFSRW